MQPQVDAERPVGHRANAPNLDTQFVRLEPQRGEDAEPSRARNLGHQLGAGYAAHAGLDDWIADPEQVAEGDSAGRHDCLYGDGGTFASSPAARPPVEGNESPTASSGRRPGRSRAGFS